MAFPTFGRGDIPTPAEIEQMKEQAGRDAEETASEYDAAARGMEQLRRYFLSAERAPKTFEDRINRGKWEGAGFQVLKVILDGEEEPRWVCLEWHKDKDLFPELSALPYPFYVHETCRCMKEACPDRIGCIHGEDHLHVDACGATRAGCPACGNLRFRPLDGDFITAVHRDYVTPGGPFAVWQRLKRAQDTKEKRRTDWKAKRKEVLGEVVEKIAHDFGKESPSLAIHRPFVAVTGGKEC